MKPLVSILIPAYNAESSIEETLQSALAQTWPRKEIIVVDDGSRDATLRVARGFESRSVLVCTQENQGAAAARNKAFQLCSGDYIQWLDADDLLSPNKVSSQMAVFLNRNNPRILLSSSWGYFLHRHRKAQFCPSPLWADLSPADWLIRKMSLNLHMQTATWLVSRQVSDVAGPWDTRLLGDDDGEYFCRILTAAEEVLFVEGAKVYYRMPGGSNLSTIGSSDQKLNAQLASIRLHIGYLRGLEESERVHVACLQYLQNWMFHFYPQRPDLVSEIRQLAAELGGTVTPPIRPWKYRWIESLAGPRVAKQAQLSIPSIKWAVLTRVDKALYGIEKVLHADSPNEMAEN